MSVKNQWIHLYWNTEFDSSVVAFLSTSLYEVKALMHHDDVDFLLQIGRTSASFVFNVFWLTVSIPLVWCTMKVFSWHRMVQLLKMAKKYGVLILHRCPSTRFLDNEVDVYHVLEMTA